MKVKQICMVLLAGIGGTLVAEAQIDFWNHFEFVDSVAPYVAERLEIGLRLSHFGFRDPERATVSATGERGGYAPGISTYTLKEKQSYLPLPYFRYNITPYVGLQLAWERLEGKTGTRDAHTLEPYDHSNGNAVLSGPSFMVYGRYPFDGIAPYAGLGLVLFSGTFKPEPGWHANGLRNMAMDDTLGYLATLGTSVRLYEVWEADLSLSYMHARPDARYWMRGDSRPRATWEFPMDSWAMQLGLKYAF